MHSESIYFGITVSCLCESSHSITYSDSKSSITLLSLVLMFLSIPLYTSTILPQKIRAAPIFSRTSGMSNRHLNMTREAESVTSESDYDVRVGAITSIHDRVIDADGS